MHDLVTTYSSLLLLLLLLLALVHTYAHVTKRVLSRQNSSKHYEADGAGFFAPLSIIISFCLGNAHFTFSYTKNVTHVLGTTRSKLGPKPL